MKSQTSVESFDTELTKETIKMVLNQLNNGDEDMKQEIFSFIEEYGQFEIMSEITKIDDTIKNIVNEYFDELMFLATGEFDIEYSNEYMLIIINYNMFTTNKTTSEINAEIASVLSICELLESGDITHQMNKSFKRRNNSSKASAEKIRMIVDQDITNLLKKITQTEGDLTTLNFNLDTDTIDIQHVYIKMTEEIYQTISNIARNSCAIKMELTQFLTELTTYYFNTTEKYISTDLIASILDKMNKDSEITEESKTYLYTEISNFLNTFGKDRMTNFFGNFSYYTKCINHLDCESRRELVLKYNSIVESRLPKSIQSETNKYFLSATNTKDDVLEILMTINRLQLQLFLQQICDTATSKIVLAHFNNNDVYTLYQLEQMIASKTFITFAVETAFLTKQLVKKIIGSILKKSFVLEDITKFTMSVEKNLVSSVDYTNLAEAVTSSKQSLSELYEEKINLSAFKSLSSDATLIQEIDSKIALVESMIKEEVFQTSEINKLEEQISTIDIYMKNTTDIKELSKARRALKSIQHKISTIEDTKYGTNFVTESTTYAGAKENFHITQLVDKYTKIFNDEEKTIKKQENKEQHLQNIETYITSIISTFDTKFSKTTSSATVQNIISFVMAKKSSMIKKLAGARKNMKSSFTDFVFTNTERVVKIFTSILYFKSHQINAQEIYNVDQNKVYENTKVYIASHDVFGTFLCEEDNKYVVMIAGETYTYTKEECVFVNTLKGKNVKIIKGVNKGLIGTVFSEDITYVLMTKDLYGKNSDHMIPRLSILKINKDSIKLLEEENQYKTQDSEINFFNDEIRNYYVNKTNSIYPITKYNYFMTLNEDIMTFKSFDFLYNIAQNLVSTFLSSVEETDKLIKDDKLILAKKMKLLTKVKSDKAKYMKLKSNIVASKMKLKSTIESHKNNSSFKNISFTIESDFTQYSAEKTIISQPAQEQTTEFVITKCANKVCDFLASL